MQRFLRAFLPPLLLAALTFAAFAPAARNGFTRLDDDRYIYENPQVRRGLTPGTALWALTSTEHANWYPLRRLTHLLDVSLFGMWAGGHHLMSAAWHAAATAVLFVALHLMTGAVWRSFAVAALFGVHPLQVESVAWAAERSNVLAGCFFALTLLLWVRYARRPGAGRYAAALAACALGLAAKPMLMTLPFLLLLLDIWPLGRGIVPVAPTGKGLWAGLRRPLLEKAPMLMLAAGSGAVTLVVHWRQEALATLESVPLGIRLGNASLSYVRYLGKLFWPTGLSIFYPYPLQGPRPLSAVLATVLLVALTVAVLSQARRRPWLGAGWLWYLGMLLPMIGIVQFGSHAMADRFVYLASVGIFLALIWQFAGSARTLLRRSARHGWAVGASLGLLAAASVAQVHRWRNDEILYAHALAVTEGNWMAHFLLGNALAARGSRQEATAHLEAAVRLNPLHADAWSNLGGSYAAQGRFEEAERALRQAVRLKPDLVAARFNLGFRLLRRGDLAGAKEQYEALRRLDPAVAESLRRFLAAGT